MRCKETVYLKALNYHHVFLHTILVHMSKAKFMYDVLGPIYLSIEPVPPTAGEAALITTTPSRKEKVF